MRRGPMVSAEGGQMLLATGLVLILALMSMALLAVQIAGLGTPYDSAASDSIATAREVDWVFQPALENRSRLLRDAGVDWDTAVWSATDGTVRDVASHGQWRGMSISVTDLQVTNASGMFTVTGVLSVVSSESWLVVDLVAAVDLT